MKPSGRIKILHVLFTLDPGGMENGVVNVACALPPADFEVHVCCLEHSGSFARRLPEPDNVHVLNKPPGFSPRAVLDLSRLIFRLQPHIVHSHNLGPLIYGALASGLGRWRPLLQGEHTLLTAWECQPRRLRQRRWLYHCCRRVHTVSEGVRRQLLGLDFPADKMVTLLNGVDTNRFAPGCRPSARRRIGCGTENDFLLGIVGRLVKGKGHLELIEAFDQLAEVRGDLHLLIIGGGGSEEEQVLARARASRAAGRIHFTGFQNDPLPYYQALDLMVCPSTHEGLSNVVLEAMACGVPVLAHPACGNPEIICAGQDGWLGELDTVQKLKTRLEQVLAQAEQLPVLGRAAREKASRQFSILNMTQKYRQLYQMLAGRAPS